MQKTFYVGLDVHKESISVTVAEEGRDGSVRFLGPISNNPIEIARLAKRLAQNGDHLEFCYEAGCCGYVIYRQITDLGHSCMVVAPSKIPISSGDRVKTDRRDSQRLAILHRSGELTRVWVPDELHEAVRDLVRARMDAAKQLTCARQQLLAFLLRYGRIYPSGHKHWTNMHRRWLAGQTFEHPAHQIVFQDYLEAVLAATDRRDHLIERITVIISGWSMKPLVEALRGLRGMDLVAAVTFVAAVGDLTRFENARQLMAYLGLVPSEHSSGSSTRRGGITKTGSNEARRMLVEASWSYRYPARVAMKKAEIIDCLPRRVREITWKAQMRLCDRYRKLEARGKKPTVVVTAIARELSGFIWAIGQEVTPVVP